MTILIINLLLQNVDKQKNHHIAVMVFNLSRRRDSNPRPADYKSAALAS